MFKVTTQKLLKIFYSLLIIIYTSASCSKSTASASHNMNGSGPQKMSYFVNVNSTKENTLSIELTISCFKGDTLNLKMPKWAPGYYMIMDYSSKVSDFHVNNGISWSQSNDNTWQLITNGRKNITVSYNVKVNDRQSVCEAELAKSHLFLPGNGIFMYPDGAINTPVYVSFAKRKEWKRTVTGLDKTKNDSYYAKNFDVLYDSPFYIGNQWYTAFKLNGKKYEISMEDTGKLNLPQFVNDIKKIITTATDIIGDIPYQHYSFIFMKDGQGGLEHSNSQADYLGAHLGEKEEDYKDLLSFIAHEFFHLYNVKAIRPIELGPFDYSAKCRTNSLWFSEGGTVYYEKYILEKSGFITHRELINDVEKVRKEYESHQGYLHQTLAESSWNVWEQFLDFLDPATFETHISYYDKGYVVTYRLNEAIKSATKGQKSLDDLMRLLYNKYYKALGRGFTEAEFWQAAESVAGCPLQEIKDQVYKLPS
jgi:predicted metalloprotease with PDZ domain